MSDANQEFLAPVKQQVFCFGFVLYPWQYNLLLLIQGDNQMSIYDYIFQSSHYSWKNICLMPVIDGFKSERKKNV